MVMELS